MRKGKVLKKTSKTAYPPFLVLVRAIIKNKNNQVLLLKRSSDHTYYPNQWELPGQRFVNKEDIPSMLQKGINNETNLIVEISSHRFYCQSRYISEGKYEGANYLEIVGEANYLTGQVKIGNDHIDHKWVSLFDVFEMDLSIESKKSLTQYVSDLQKDQSFYESRLPVLVSARGLIKNSKGQYLMLKRFKNDSSYASQWDLPGGKLNSLEVLNELLKREVFEETGLVIAVDKPAMYINSHVLSQGKYSGYTFINLVSSAHITAGEVKLSEEHEDFGWFTKDKIFSLDIAPHVRLCLTEIFLKHTV